MHDIQAERLQAIQVEIKITMEAVVDGKIDREDLSDLVRMYPEGSIKHAAYTVALALLQA